MVESLPAPVVAPYGPRPPRDEIMVLRLGATPAAEGSAQAGSQVAADAAQWHTVRAGETLASIARDALGSSLLAEELARLNSLDLAAALTAGQRLRLR